MFCLAARGRKSQLDLVIKTARLNTASFFPPLVSLGTQQQACPSSRQGDVASQPHLSGEEWGRPALRPNHPGKLPHRLYLSGTPLNMGRGAAFLHCFNTRHVPDIGGFLFLNRRPRSGAMASRRACPRSLAARQRPPPRLKGETACCGRRHLTSTRRELSPPKRSSGKR